jgi:hypothetical protein
VPASLLKQWAQSPKELFSSTRFSIQEKVNTRVRQQSASRGFWYLSVFVTACAVLLLSGAATLSPTPTFTVLTDLDRATGYSFDLSFSPMVQGFDGNFYGVFASGGAHGVSDLGLLGICIPRASALSSFFQPQNRDTRTVRNSFTSNPSVALSGV